MLSFSNYYHITNCLRGKTISLASRGEDVYLMVGSVVCHIRDGGGSGLGGAKGFPFLNHTAEGSLNLGEIQD